MNLAEFTRANAPRLRRAAVEPFLADVLTLRSTGYSLAQVCEYLASNGVSISVAGLSAYLRRVDAKSHPEVPSPQAAGVSAQRSPSAPHPQPLASPIPPPAPTARRRFEGPPDPMDVMRDVRQMLRQDASTDPPPQGDSIDEPENRSPQ